MSYQPVSVEELLEDKMSDLEDIPYGERRADATKWSVLARLDVIARYVSYLLVLALAIKVFTNPWQQCKPQSQSDKSPTIHKTYGVDQDYFSLDSNFDYLWEPDLDPAGSVIFDEWFDERGQWQEGVVGM